MSVRYKVGGALIEFKDGWTEITLNSGHLIHCPWKEQPGQRAEAERLGYKFVVDMNRDHDPLHVVVAHILGLPDSGPLSYAATKVLDPMWQYEETIVFAMQGYLALRGWTVDRLLTPYREAACF